MNKELNALLDGYRLHQEQFSKIAMLDPWNDEEKAVMSRKFDRLLADMTHTRNEIVALAKCITSNNPIESKVLDILASCDDSQQIIVARCCELLIINRKGN